jgi:hypothetical protein
MSQKTLPIESNIFNENNEDEVIYLPKPEDKDKKISYEIGYLVPFWSSKPLHKYFLEVWREGTIINTIDVSSKEYYVIGRNKNIVDIYQNNITVSRVHAIIQHKDDGELYIYDMDSVYGTCINKKSITKKTYIKLNVGDTFKLGKSGKMFIVNGPSELLPEEDIKPINLIDKKELIKKRENQIRQQHEQRENYKRNLLGVNRNDVDWGQKDFDEEIQRNQKEDEDSDKEKEIDYYGPLKLEELKIRKDLSEKQKGLIEKLEINTKNINRLKDEIIKIQKKEFESGELKDGQKKRIEMNEKKLLNAYERQELLEDNLRVSLSSKDGITNTEQKFDKKLARDINSDEDEFFDRAKITNNFKKDNNKNITITENYETLKSKLEILMRKRQKLVDKVLKFDEEWTANQKEEEDTLDAFFNETKNKIKSDEKSKLTNLISETNKEISK